VGKDKDKSIWETLGYHDHDFDGDIDLTDALIEDEEFEQLKKELYPEHRSVFDEDDFDDHDFDADDEGGDYFYKSDDDDTNDYAVVDDSHGNDDADDDTDDSNPSLTLSFSVEKPPRTKPTTGFWPYYDEKYNRWDLKRALFDQFPELKKSRYSKYDFEFFVGKFEFHKDPQRALGYLDYLLDHFPFESAQELSRGNNSTMNNLIIEIVYWMESEDNKQHSKYLYAYLNNNERYFNALFIRYKWDNWDEVYPNIYSYFKPFISNNNHKWLVKAHETMLKHQSKVYTEEIQDEFWKWAINNEESNERRRQGQSGFYWSVPIPDEAYEFFMGVVESLGFEAKKARQALKDHAPEDTSDSIENEIEELDSKIKGLLYKKEQLLKRLLKHNKKR
jgi:hypothetical protein